jgi:hypothetical protein
VRETESLNKTGVLKHVKDIILKIRKITDRLAKVNTLPGQNPGNKKKKKCLVTEHEYNFLHEFDRQNFAF